MSLVYWLSKFSHEAMLIELFLIACISASYFLYLLVQKRRYGVAKKNIPDNVVRAYLVEMISQAEGFKNQLFGESFQIPTGRPMMMNSSPQATVTAAGGGVDAGELAAIKAALGGAIAKQEELQRAVAALNKDKAALEARLAAGGAPAAAAGDGDPKALADASDKIAKLESKLAEYEVIEDDLANLKKYQQENKQLRSQLDAFQKGGGGAPTLAIVPPPAAVAAPPPAATVSAAPPPPPAASASPVAAAEESAAAIQAVESFEGLVDKVEESLAPPASGATAADPMASKAPAPMADEPTLAEPALAPPKEKSDADLLNEFERMLSS